MTAGARIEQRPGRLPSSRTNSLGVSPLDRLCLSGSAREYPLELVARADPELREHLVQVVLDGPRADAAARPPRACARPRSCSRLGGDRSLGAEVACARAARGDRRRRSDRSFPQADALRAISAPRRFGTPAARGGDEHDTLAQLQQAIRLGGRRSLDAEARLPAARHRIRSPAGSTTATAPRLDQVNAPLVAGSFLDPPGAGSSPAARSRLPASATVAPRQLQERQRMPLGLGDDSIRPLVDDRTQDDGCQRLAPRRPSP